VAVQDGIQFSSSGGIRDAYSIYFD